VQQEALLAAITRVLESARRAQHTLTYLAIADAVAMPGPQRIHKTTTLLEILLARDHAAGRPLSSALAVSRTPPYLPAQGFFERARELGLFVGTDPAASHRSLLAELYASDP